MKYFIFGCIFLLNSFAGIAIANSVSISEVFRDGTDEWIELKVDEASEDTSVYILSGAKSSIIEIEIPATYTGYFLLYDGGNGIEHVDACRSVGGQGLSLSDTREVHLGLYLSGERIDDFFISSEAIEKYNNSYTSFVMSSAVVPYTGNAVNSLQGYLGSPCYGILDNASSGNNDTVILTGENSGMTGLILTGSSQESILTGDDEMLTGATDDILPGGNEHDGEESTIPPLVEISEVYPFDTELFGEYIAIRANRAVDGKVEIYGLGQGSTSKIVYVSMLSGEIAYLTDSPGRFSIGENVYVLPSISLTNRGEELQVKVNNSLTDTVRYLPGTEYESVYYSYADGSTRILSSPGIPSPSSGGFDSLLCDITLTQLASGSGFVSGKILVDSSMETLCETSGALTTIFASGNVVQQIVGCEDAFQFSGTISEFEVNFSSQFGSHCHEKIYLFGMEKFSCNEREEKSPREYFSGDIYIDEIYPYDTTFPEYIEVVFLRRFSGELTIEGGGRGGASKDIFIDAYTGQRVIFSSTYSGFSDDVIVKIIPGLSLTNGGEKISLHGQVGQLFDSVYFEGENESSAQYFSAFSGTVREFLTGSRPTPGFTYGMVRHLFDQEEKVSTCGIVLQHKTPIFASNKANFIATFNKKELQNSSPHTCIWTIDEKQIDGLEGCNPSYISLEGTGMSTIGLEVITLDGEHCSVSSSLNFPEKSSEKSGTGKSPEYYQGLYKKWKGRYELLKKGVKKFGFEVTTSGDVYMVDSSSESFDTPVFATGFILGVLPNPSGKDQGNEGLRLQNLLTGTLDLSEIKLRINGKNKSLNVDGILNVGEERDLFGTLGLTNKPSCVELLLNNVPLDRFCYPQAQDDIWYTSSIPVGKSVEEIKLLGDMKVEIEDQSACLSYVGNTITCTPYGVSLLDAKQWKKDLKKLPTLQKSLEKVEGKYDVLNSKYGNLKKKSSSQLSDARSEKNVLLGQNKLHQGFARMLISTLYDKFSPITKQEDIKVLLSVYNKLANNTISPMSEYGLSIPTWDIGSYVKLQQGSLTLHNTDVEKLEKHLKSTISNGIQAFTLYTATSPP